MKPTSIKLLSVAFYLFFSMSAFAAEVVTVGGLKYELNGSEAYVAGYEGSPTDVVIPETIVSEGQTFRVTRIGSTAFRECSSITSLTSTGGNLKSIGNYAFSNSPNLKYLKLICAEESFIGNYAFYSCPNLEEVNLTCSRILCYSFSSCGNLQKVTLDGVEYIGENDFNYKVNDYYHTLNSFGNTFSSCSNLTYIDLGDKLNTINENAFSGCTKLTYVVIPATCVNYYYFERDRGSSYYYYRKGSFMDYNSVFSGCTRLQSIIYLGDQTSKCGSNATVYHPKDQVQWSSTSFDYQGKSPTATFTSDMPAGFEVTAYDMPVLEKDAGTYTQNVPFTFANNDMSFDVEIPYKYTINPVTLTAKVKDASRLYGDADPDFSSTYTGFVNNEDESVLTSNGSYTTTATVKSDVGTYTIKQSGATAQNYVFEYEDGTLTVNKAPLTMTANDKTMTYGGKLPTFDAKYEGLKNNEAQPAWNTEPKYSTTATSASKVGTYPITISDADAKNYQLTVNEGTMTVGKAELTVSADNKSRIYGDANPEFTLTYTGLKNGETMPEWEKKPTVETTADAKSNVGTYPISVKDAVAENYNITAVDGTLTVKKAALQITPKDATRKYGEENPKFELSYSGLKNNESVPEWTTDPVITTNATKTSSVGDYAIQVKSAEARNYTLEKKVGTLTVTKAPLTMTANDKTMTYGGKLPTFDAKYEGLRNNETQPAWNTEPKFSTTATSASKVGTYPITISDADAKNYQLTIHKGTMSVEKAELTVTADNKSRLYGDANPKFTLTYTGLKNDETAPKWEKKPTIETTADAKSNVGTYPISVKDAVAVNYNITVKDGTLTVKKAALQITPKDATRKYGEENPKFELSYSGLKNNESVPEWTTDPVITTNATKTSSVGDYAIQVKSAEARNYTLEKKEGTLTVTKAPLSVGVNSYNRKYGEANPTFELHYDGLLNNETAPEWTKLPTITTTAKTKSDVGEYAIVATGGVMKNYEAAEITPGVLTITTASLTIKANDASRLYYEDNPEFSFSCTGFVGSDNESVLTTKPKIKTNATKKSNVGVYPIEIGNAVSKNYTISYEKGQLTVKKRQLTVSTKDYTRAYGEENPEFELSYKGFVNKEDENVLLSKPKATTTATVNTDVGVYDIVVGNGVAENYDFSYVGGKLTIEKAYQTLTWDQDFSDVKQYEQVELLATASSGLDITYSIEGEQICSIIKIGSKQYLDCKSEGEVVVVAIQEGNKNYWQSTKIYKAIVIESSVGINHVTEDVDENMKVYDVSGNQINKLQKGLNIIKMSNGKTKKVFVK